MPSENYRDLAEKRVGGGRCERYLPLELESLRADRRPDLNEHLFCSAEPHADGSVDAGLQQLTGVNDDLPARIHQVQIAACCVHDAQNTRTDRHAETDNAAGNRERKCAENYNK